MGKRENPLSYGHLGERTRSTRRATGAPSATRAECADFAKRVAADPRNYIAQPRIELSSCPSWTSKAVEPRRVDLRPFVVTGDRSWVLPGGLTRVALRKGSYVVNSSQGGGSKDTWVVGENT